MHVVNIVMFYAYVYKLCIEICVSATYALNVVLTETSVFGIIFFHAMNFYVMDRNLPFTSEVMWQTSVCESLMVVCLVNTQVLFRMQTQ